MMINKLGLEVENTARQVREELLRGTGMVMAEHAALFIENSNFRDQQIVVARCPDGRCPLQRAAFDMDHFKDAWEQFEKWRRA